MKTKKVCGAVLLVLAGAAVLLGLLTISSGGVLFLVFGAFFLVSGVVLLKNAKTEEADAPADQKSVDWVYVTSKGGRFHEYPDCPSIKNSAQVRKIPRGKAVSAGYKPCESCRRESDRYFYA